MQDRFDDNDILMYSTHNNRKSVIAERFIKKLKGKLCKKMTANDNKSYLSCFNKLVDQYSNTYDYSVNKKPVNTDYFALTEKIETNLRAPKFKINEGVSFIK